MRAKPIEWQNVERVAAEWGVSGARVRTLIGQGRIPGAKRSKARGTCWLIPARWDGKKYVVSVFRAKSFKSKIPMALSPADGG